MTAFGWCPMSSEFPIPDSAVEAAAKALEVSESDATDGHAWFRAHAEAAVGASAPLVVAAANEPAMRRLMVLAQKIVTQASQASRASQIQALEDIAFEVAEIARGLSASVLRGEGQTDA